jgi:hypothetical protein
MIYALFLASTYEVEMVLFNFYPAQKEMACLPNDQNAKQRNKNNTEQRGNYGQNGCNYRSN